MLSFVRSPFKKKARRAQEKVIIISDSDDHSIENRSNAEYCLDSPPIIPSSDSDSVSELPDDKLPMVPPGLKTKNGDDLSDSDSSGGCKSLMQSQQYVLTDSDSSGEPKSPVQPHQLDEKGDTVATQGTVSITIIELVAGTIH
ncbi:uncharacterized protein [Dysidea avara]|uniref:uncharacterized protein n=1 Tax=Dysidea avara TaxID=196820 RepID=UPI0033185280